MSIGFIALIVLAVFIFLIIGNKGSDDKCSKCGMKGTREVIAGTDEYSDSSMPKTKGNGVNALYFCKCQHCGHTWEEVQEQEFR